MEFFDTHTHYDDEQFNMDRKQVIDKIYKAGVTKCIDVGCDIETSKKAIELANDYDFIYAICGFHPSMIASSEKEILEDIEKIRELCLNNKKVVAIGEIGLDYHYEGINKDLQQFAFREQINLANELGLPISVHTRDAIDDTIGILTQNAVKKGGVLHCCPFNRELVKHGLKNDFYIAFGGTVTFKNSKNAYEIVNMVPDDRILIETDCPYLAPHPIRGTRNDSSNLSYVVQKIAEFRKEEPEKIAKMTYENASRLFLNNL